MTIDYFSKLWPQQDPAMAKANETEHPWSTGSPNRLNNTDTLEPEPIEIHTLSERVSESQVLSDNQAGPAQELGQMMAGNEMVNLTPHSRPGAHLPATATVVDELPKPQGSEDSISAPEKNVSTHKPGNRSEAQKHGPLPGHPPTQAPSRKTNGADPGNQETAVPPSISAEPLPTLPPPVKEQRPAPGKPVISQQPARQIRQSVFNEVRQWVAAQDEITTEKQRAQVSQEIIGKVDQALLKIPPKEPAKPLDKSREKRLSGSENLAIHDLSLSIGPINITMEGSEKKSPRPVSASKQPVRPAELGTSRLSRHYIIR
ncbi:MAG: hypothetical protein KJ630_04145 [Proteobacteria bacterium]|nr:hypothetical protein [Pseudomonadota bacterium]